jgi:tetratricopeptide (TPR) repeat protein
MDAAKALSTELDTWAADNEEPSEDFLERRLILAARLATADNDTARALEILGPLRSSQRGKNAFMNWALAETYIAAEQWDEAEKALAAVINHAYIGYEGLVPWIFAHYQMGKVYEHLDRKDEAARYYQRFVDIWGNADTSLPDVEAARQRLSALTQ